MAVSPEHLAPFVAPMAGAALHCMTVPPPIKERYKGHKGNANSFHHLPLPTVKSWPTSRPADSFQVPRFRHGRACRGYMVREGPVGRRGAPRECPTLHPHSWDQPCSRGLPRVTMSQDFEAPLLWPPVESSPPPPLPQAGGPLGPLLLLSDTFYFILFILHKQLFFWVALWLYKLSDDH